MRNKTRPYREALLDALSDPIEAEHYLNAAISDSLEMFLKALRNVAQSRQMARVARKAGINRESIYRATSVTGNPTLDTLDSVLSALGLKLRIEAASSLSTPASISRMPSGAIHRTTPAPMPLKELSQRFYRPEILTPPTPQEPISSRDLPPAYVIVETQNEYASIQ